MSDLYEITPKLFSELQGERRINTSLFFRSLKFSKLIRLLLLVIFLNTDRGRKYGYNTSLLSSLSVTKNNVYFILNRTLGNFKNRSYTIDSLK